MNGFKDYFNTEGELFSIEVIKEKSISEDVINDIRKGGFKIKAIHPTRFGREVVFFNTTDAEGAAQLVGTDKIAGKSIFVEV